MNNPSDSVYAEGQPVVTSPSPYDECREELTILDPPAAATVNEHQKLRLECIRLAFGLDVGNNADLIMTTAKRFWRFVRSGD